ncbi:MAG: SurA N-terminal domain-containing protein, partial [Betaproteobacteria bacterium]
TNENAMNPKKLLIASLSLLLVSAPTWGQSLGLDRIAVVVNNEAITDLEVKQRMVQARSMLAERGIATPSEDVVRRQVIEQMVVERAGQQLAKEMNMRVDDAAVDMRSIKSRAIINLSATSCCDALQARAAIYRVFAKDCAAKC